MCEGMLGVERLYVNCVVITGTNVGVSLTPCNKRVYVFCKKNCGRLFFLQKLVALFQNTASGSADCWLFLKTKNHNQNNVLQKNGLTEKMSHGIFIWLKNAV